MYNLYINQFLAKNKQTFRKKISSKLILIMSDAFIKKIISDVMDITNFKTSINMSQITKGVINLFIYYVIEMTPTNHILTTLS